MNKINNNEKTGYFLYTMFIWLVENVLSCYSWGWGMHLRQTDRQRRTYRNSSLKHVIRRYRIELSVHYFHSARTKWLELQTHRKIDGYARLETSKGEGKGQGIAERCSVFTILHGWISLHFNKRRIDGSLCVISSLYRHAHVFVCLRVNSGESQRDVWSKG